MKKSGVVILLIFCLLISACDQGTKVETDTPFQQKPAETATPTNPQILPRPDEPTDTPSAPTTGEIELRIPFDIYSPSEVSSSSLPECVQYLPFRILSDGDRKLIEGKGRLECSFVDTPKGSPITYHVILTYDAIFNGELLPASPNKPSGWLDSFLTIDGEVAQFYVGYPPEAANPCPEENPCRTPVSEVIPLPFDYRDESSISTPWTFILHLD